MTVKTLGMGIVKNILTKKSGNIYSKLVKNKTKSKAEQILDNVYKKDPTGKKDRAIKNMNEFLKKKKRQASPAMIDRYHEIMTSDRQVKPGKK